jgi:hypothetical protein
MFTFFTVYKTEIEMRSVIFYYCRQDKGGKKIHHKPSDVYGNDSYSLGAVKYWVREFKAQRTHLHDEVRPGRPLIDVSAHVVRLLNNKPFSLTRHLAQQLAVTKEVAKRNLQEVLGFHKFGLKWVPNVLSTEQKTAGVQMPRELHNNVIFEWQKLLLQSSPETRIGVIGLMRNRRCGHDHAIMFQQGNFRKLIPRNRHSQYFSAERNLHSFILYQNTRIWILTICATLFWKGKTPLPLLKHKKRL